MSSFRKHMESPIHPTKVHGNQEHISFSINILMISIYRPLQIQRVGLHEIFALWYVSLSQRAVLACVQGNLARFSATTMSSFTGQNLQSASVPAIYCSDVQQAVS